MAILRNPNKERFTVVDNYALRDVNLSLKARGLLVTMMSLPDNWHFSENGLCAILQKDGQSAIRSCLKELEQLGYLTRTRTRDSSGRVSNVVWTICDKPQLENPSVDDPSLVNPNLENRPQLNTYKSNTYESNTDLINTNDSKRKRRTTDFVPPTLQEVEEYARSRNSIVDPKRFWEYFDAGQWKDAKGQSVRSWKQKFITWENKSGETKKEKEPERKYEYSEWTL